jgi:signal transduction histidine kinase
VSHRWGDLEPALKLAALGVLVAILTLAVLRLGYLGDLGAGPATPQTWLPILVATAAWCVLILIGSTRPSVGWLAAILALVTVTLDLAGLLRGARATADAPTWSWLLLLLAVVAVGTVAAAAAYAADPARRLGWWVLPVAVGGVVVMAAAAVVAIATAPGPVDRTTSPLGSGSLVTRGFLIVTLGLVALGILGDLRPAARRARRRLAVERPTPTTGRDRVDAGLLWARLFADELSPGRTRAGRAATAERSRLARDLHAEVVPGLRRALAQASGDAPVGELESTLRGVLGTVESIGNDEHAIQLELGGLVPAIEWLAERAEAESTVRITIDVVEHGTDAGSPPAEVAAAAYRVAGLAIDNVLRHAPGSAVAIRVESGASVVHLAIDDDGPGLDPAAVDAARRAGHRGLADMATEAAGCGGSLAIEPMPGGGRGTRVRFDWPAA